MRLATATARKHLQAPVRYRSEEIVTTQAPRAFNRQMYDHHPEKDFYGTEDGYQDGSITEFQQNNAH
jgi:hypothetical protein